MGEWEECELGRGLCVGVWGRSGMHLGGVGMLQGHPEVARGVLDTSRRVCSTRLVGHAQGSSLNVFVPEVVGRCSSAKNSSVLEFVARRQIWLLERGPLLTCT